MSYDRGKDYEMSTESDGMICTFTKLYNGRRFTGEAYCHEEDIPFLSEHTGLTIAEARATIKYLKFKKNCEVLPALKTLAHILNTLPKACEVKPTREYLALKAEHDRLAALYSELTEDIKGETESLKEYIEKKDALHERLAKRQ